MEKNNNTQKFAVTYKYSLNGRTQQSVLKIEAPNRRQIRRKVRRHMEHREDVGYLGIKKVEVL